MVPIATANGGSRRSVRHPLPSVEPPSGADDTIAKYFRTSASMAGTPDHLAVLMGKIRHPLLILGRPALWALSTAVGTLLMCGRKSISREFPYVRRFSEVEQEKREEIMLSWANSRFFIFRLLFTSQKVFTLLLYFTQVNEKFDNISFKAMGYKIQDPAPLMKELQQLGDIKQEHTNGYFNGSPLEKGIINLGSKDEAFSRLHDLGFSISFKNSSFTIKCDAVVVGSGSGGGVIAGVLGQKGYKVIVLEKGSYLPSSNFPLSEGQSMDQMYLGNGIVATDNMEVFILAGATVGGGSTINWSASIRTPEHVRKEWSEILNLKMFQSDVYENALDVVSQRIGVQSEFEQEGFNNMILRQGCKNLGIPVETIPRNAGSDHYCGSCCFGCRDGRKKGVAQTWLLDMVSSGNGAILPECEAEKVIISKRAAKGVRFKFNGNEIATIESKVTIVACGAISTPPLLKNSGLENRNIGKNLHLHPVIMAWGYFPDSDSSTWPESDKRSHEGGIMTAMSSKHIISENSYGAVIQTPALHPGMFSILMPWISGEDMKKRMLKFARTAHIFSLARDRGSGTIHSPSHISYKMDKSDEENLQRGIETVLRVLAAAGAEEIGTHHRTGRVLKVKEASKEEFERFVREESGKPLEKMWSPIASAHQMGSCRMGVDPAAAVVRPNGEMWEVEGLFVADTSVFPTALGVNPMITVQAIAYCTAGSVLSKLAGNNMG